MTCTEFFKALGVEGAVKVYGKANAREKADLRPLLAAKQKDLHSKPPHEAERLAELLNKTLNSPIGKRRRRSTCRRTLSGAWLTTNLPPNSDTEVTEVFAGAAQRRSKVRVEGP